jgi:glutathione-independent formaldehyde dehydrogenase
MRGVVLTGKREVALEVVDDPELQAPTDALMRVTSTAVCGTDLHFYGGRMGAEAGMLIGHEPLGVVEEVGPAVVSISVGDRVVVPTHICCGFCPSCVHGYSGACLTVNPGKAGGAYGYPGMGGYRGTQAELVCVPFADANCLRLPGEPGDENEHDFVLLADALPTGYHALELAMVRPGDSLAIYGAGAIGLLAAYCALRLRGVTVVYVVDHIRERLDKAGELGAVPIDFTQGDAVDQIYDHQRRRRRREAAWRGQEVMDGVDRAIDAVGFQTRDFADTEKENPRVVIGDLARLINPTGGLGIIGVFSEPGLRESRDLVREGHLDVPWGKIFGKGVRIGMGRDHDERYNDLLRDLIAARRIHPGTIVSHRLPLDDAPDAYRRFDERRDGYLKVVLDPTIAAT